MFVIDSRTQVISKTMENCYSCNLDIKERKIYKCLENHVYCLSCAYESDEICSCSSVLLERENELQKPKTKKEQIGCSYKALGCTYTFPESSYSFDYHVTKECKFRPIDCILKQLEILRCPWENSQCQFEAHFIDAHKEFKVLTFNDKTEFYCNLNEAAPRPYIKSFRLINAFSKNFGLYFLVDKKAKLVSIVIFLIGSMKVASQFFYTLTLKAPGKQQPMIKFIQPCCNDGANVVKTIQNGRCVSLPQHAAFNYIENHKLEVLFRLSKKINDEVGQ